MSATITPVNPMGRALLAAAALLAGATLVYGAALFENVFIGAGGLDGPCMAEIRYADEGLGVSTRDQSYWPPRTTCAIRDRSGELARTTVYEWPWLPAAMIAFVAGAACALGAGIMARRRG